jgi:hypothetical protein
MKKTWTTTLLALALAATLPLHAAEAQAQIPDEEFQYRWQLRNFVGTLAGLFLPNRGTGSLTFQKENGRLRSELLITSELSDQGEYFRYGSEIDSRTLKPIRAWSSYSWRGETKSKTDRIEDEGVLDIASGIFSIRRDPPEKPRRMEIWSDGKVYPVVVIPMGEVQRKVGGRQVAVNHYSIRGVRLPDRRRWKGKLDLWLAQDETSTPVEILISRNMADVHLELQNGK